MHVENWKAENAGGVEKVVGDVPTKRLSLFPKRLPKPKLDTKQRCGHDYHTDHTEMERVYLR